ncbi:DUF262 domain-containing protein [Marinobacter sp. ATCH36]|uniref:GmrSD restriction endonuclease domain-containing protein n=1 Tax=Marinobacter sp. ATCH36 TaxID=2945106 RepID=UPI0020222C47|nr:DUF262 domain-containing protein [Marinobacter sp. ATCH36]MCL7942354.1 DUF262 domain-containing protein [Marinobacter sp. ATCH36]
MEKSTTGLSIKGESIQSLYGSYLSGTFLVNRRYQRKLIWTVEEKRSFLDSIAKDYPVPLILLAEVGTDLGRRLEIIDGMQRMNAIMSFIGQEFDLEGSYFDLDTMADTKLLKDQNKLTQKQPVLDRSKCASIVRYQVPLSIFQETGNSHVDEVFRRLNSGGRKLSKQELRQAGTTSKFASIVRKISSNIRGDSSASDTLNLSAMKNISITNKNLNYGIPVEEIFWVKNSIITKEALRQSQDEEVIADIVAWVAMDKGIRSSSDILDQLYGFKESTNGDSESSLSSTLEMQIQKINEDVVLTNVQFVLDELIRVVGNSGKSFNSLLFRNQQAKISRYFQIVYLAIYSLLIDDGCEIVDEKMLIQHLDGAGDKTIKLSAGGGNWSAKEKQTQVDALYGVIRNCFGRPKSNDPARNQWITRFENILMQSSTEQNLYDFKIGLHDLKENSNSINRRTFSKIIKTLTAMANTFPRSTGYCILGVSDSKESSEIHKETYGSEPIKYSSFYVTGVDGEANRYHNDIDKYFTKLVQFIDKEPLAQRDKDNISRNITTVRYFGKSVIILKIESGDSPAVYDDKYYVRHGSNITEIEPANFGDLFSRFHENSK